MNSAGVLLDIGPLVALLSRTDAKHRDAKALFASCLPPLRTCEAVLAEAAHLLGKNSPAAVSIDGTEEGPSRFSPERPALAATNSTT
jgi:predicted nucleic acid-binding protein